MQVAKALIEFETLWHQAWIKSIEQCKAGLAAPLLVQHPETGKILVNFDKEIMQLVREAKYMQRFNIAVPESAQMVLLQVRRRRGWAQLPIVQHAYMPTYMQHL